jgi:hypothetical protein
VLSDAVQFFVSQLSERGRHLRSRGWNSPRQAEHEAFLTLRPIAGGPRRTRWSPFVSKMLLTSSGSPIVLQLIGWPAGAVPELVLLM